MVAFITRVVMAAALVGAVLPTAYAKCKGGEFLFKEMNQCLTYGGPTKHASAPKGKACPPSGWAWSSKLGGCVPKFPPTHYPQCPKNYEWCSPEWACVPVPTKPTPSPPKPSKKPGKGKREAQVKRIEEIPLPKMCPVGYDACPIPTATGLSADYECIDTTSELESCGGCASLGEGQDCTAIPGVWNVACTRGQCQVSSCAPGFTLSKAEGRCIAN